ncbi:MAG: outer membrane lipoprotein carrier protein LolA [Pseudomonadota bacterium]
MNATIFTLLLALTPATDPGVLAAGIQSFYREKQDFAAEFSQEIERPNLPDRPLKKRGRVFFKKPGLMRWDYLEPDKVYYISDGEVLWNYIPESALAYKLLVKDSELFYALRFLFGEGDLEKDFLVSAGAPEGELLRLVLKPRNDEQTFKEVHLLADPATFEIMGTIVIDPADNASRIRFTKLSYTSLKTADFHFEAPKGVRVEDLSNPVAPPK